MALILKYDGYCLFVFSLCILIEVIMSPGQLASIPIEYHIKIASTPLFSILLTKLIRDGEETKSSSLKKRGCQAMTDRSFRTDPIELSLSLEFMC